MADNEVIVSVKADTSQFNSSLNKSKQTADKFDKSVSKSATNGATKLEKSTAKASASLKRLSKSSAAATTSQNRLSSALSNAATNASLVDGPLGGIASRLSALSSITKKGAIGFAALAVGLAAFVKVMKNGIATAEEFKQANLKIQGVLNATGNSVGFTTKQISAFANEMALTTLAGSEEVERASAKLLFFTGVQEESFKDVIRAAQGLSDLGFGNLVSNTQQLGRALEDPIQGMSLLRRQLGSFTAAEEAAIRTAIEFNDLQAAQAVILDKLKNKLGNVSTELNTGLTGAVDELGERWRKLNIAIGDSAIGEFFESISLAVLSALNSTFKALTNLLSNDVNVELDNARNKLLQLNAQLLASERGSGRLTSALTSTRDALILKIAALEKSAVAQNKEEAAAKVSAKTAREKAKADRLSAKAAEIARGAQEALNNLRKSTIEGLRGEIVALEAKAKAREDLTLTTEQLVQAEEKAVLLAKASLGADSAQGKQIAELVDRKHELTNAIKEEDKARKQVQGVEARLKALNNESAAIALQTESIGKSTEEMEAAALTAKKLRIEQELIAANGGTNKDVFKQQAIAIAEAETQLESFQQANQEAFQAEEEMNAMRLSFQESLASGLTGVIMGTESLEGALKRMILQLSEAIVQAKILEAVQLSMGTDSTGASTGGGSGDLISAGIGALFGGGESGGSSTPVMHTGGMVGSPTGSKRSVSPSTFIGAPRFHTGLRADEFPAILQKGEEVIPKDQVGQARVSSNNVTINVTTPDANSFRASQRQIARKIKTETSRT